MTYFPVSSSIVASDALGLLLQKQYNFSSSATCRLLKAGINHSYLVTDHSSQYIFRLYSLHWRSETEIREEIRLLQLAYDQSVPVSVALPDSTQNYIQELDAPEGKRLGVLFTFAPGEKQLNMSADLHFKAGQAMAKLHQVTHNLGLERVYYTPKHLLIDSFEHLKKFLSITTPEMQFMLLAQTYLLEQFETIDYSDVRKGAVHMDIWFDNMSIWEDQITFFDFDFCGNGMLCHDIAYYILQIHSTEKDEVECMSKKESFLTGYTSILPITNEERRLLPMLGVCSYFFYLGIQCQRYENWSNTFLNEIYLKRFISLLVKKYYESNQLG